MTEQFHVVLPLSAKPLAPKELVVTAISQDSVSLTWNYHDLDKSSVTSYRIERRMVSHTRSVS
jgi:hypothetical protein